MVVAREKKLAAAETIRTAAAAAQEGANEAASYGAAAAWTVELGLRTVAVARWNDLAAASAQKPTKFPKTKEKSEDAGRAEPEASTSACAETTGKQKELKSRAVAEAGLEALILADEAELTARVTRKRIDEEQRTEGRQELQEVAETGLNGETGFFGAVTAERGGGGNCA